MKVKARNFPHTVLNPVSDDFQRGHFKGMIYDFCEEDQMLIFKIQLDYVTTTYLLRKS